MHLKKILAYGISNLDVVGQAGTLGQIISGKANPPSYSGMECH